MKFFLSELGLCFGGTVITPATEMIVADVANNRPRVRHSKAAKNWKPELSAISEDGTVKNVCQQSRELVRSEKKPLSKTRSVAKTRSNSYSSGDYRKFTHPMAHSMALPAFSPTPFVF